MVAKVKMGSDMSNKQLAQSVVQGHQLRFDLSNGDSVTGYLAGIDDYTYLVASKGKPLLLHKGNVAVVHLRTGQTLDDEGPTIREAIEPIIAPFREFCQRVLLNNGERQPSKALL